ncbi:exported hypothetical protein [Candidatus Magnetomoraceae bacterium gMMP-15]
MKFIFFLTVLCLITPEYCIAAVPIINSVPDQQVAEGIPDYTYTPSLSSGDNVKWVKEYGPDDMTLNASTGTVSWKIPHNLPGESFHIGVKAINAEGSDTEVWIVTVGNGNVIYCGVGEKGRETLALGMGVMNSGDTLIMRNGIYTGKSNAIRGNKEKLQQPPGGSPTSFTTVMAEDPGSVILDGGGTVEEMLHLTGNYKHPQWGTGDGYPDYYKSYIALKGFVCRNTSSSPIIMVNVQYVKLIDISVYSEVYNANIYLVRCDHLLLEGINVWGCGRYKIQFKFTDNSICRRSVVRMDRTTAHNPYGGFTAYTCRNILFQNCIAVDGDHPEFHLNWTNMEGTFAAPATGNEWYPKGIEFVRCIALNNATRMMNNAGSEVLTMKDCIGWKHDISGAYAVIGAAGSYYVEQCTIGDVYMTESQAKYGFLYARGSSNEIHETIMYRWGRGQDQGPFLKNVHAVNYCNIYDWKGTWVVSGHNYGEVKSNPFFTDPANNGLKYLPRIEDGNSLQTVGDNGKRVGANIMTFIGKSGSFYGNSGYNTETNISCWPFPHEDLIKEKMMGYSYTGPTRDGSIQTLSGIRGFCTGNSLDGTPQTLTKYIWEYLGNPIPPEIYGGIGVGGTIQKGPSNVKAFIQQQ